MPITRNAAKCATCDVEIESKHRHDFNVHYCPQNPMPALEWKDNVLVAKEPPETTWNFAVDGGHAYIKRSGTGYIELSTGTGD